MILRVLGSWAETLSPEGLGYSKSVYHEVSNKCYKSKGLRTQIKGLLGPRYHQCCSICTLKPYNFFGGLWTLRVVYNIGTAVFPRVPTKPWGPQAAPGPKAAPSFILQHSSTNIIANVISISLMFFLTTNIGIISSNFAPA